MKRITVLLCSLLFCAALFAQTRQVTGTVRDASNQPVVAATVKVKGSSVSTTTNAEGQFSLNVPSGSNTLEISSVGFTNQEIAIGADNTVSVSLAQNTTQMNEVVVTALGVSKQNKKLGYAVSTVRAEEIQRANTISPITALQGKVAGLDINVMGASGVQSSPSIMIRGAKSLRQGNNQAMFVIDGMVIENNTYDADAVDQGSQLKNLNPDDYESITVLKGAAATSLYGSRGANGAIVITTKKGRANQGLGISVSSTYQVENIYKNGVPLQNVYGRGFPYQREGHFLPDGTQLKTSNSYGPRMDGSLHPAEYDDTKMVPYSPQPDNWKAFYQDGIYINNNVALSGGGDKFTYRISYSNLNNKGTLPNNKVERNSFDFRTTGQLNKVFSIDGGVSYAMTDAKNPYGQGRYYWPSGQNLGFLTYYSVPRNTDLATWRDNYRNPDGSKKNYGYGQWNDVVNATFNRFDNVNNTNHERSLLTNVMLKAQLNSWIDLSAKANLNYYRIFYENKERGGDAFGAGGSYAIGGNYNTAYNYLFSAHAAQKAFNDNLDIDFRLVNEIYGTGQKESYGARTDGGLIVPNIFTLSNSVNAIQNYLGYGYNTPDKKVIGVGGILNLGWKDYLNLELTGRQDWISSLTYPNGVPGANNYGVFYPSANVSWAFSEMWKNSMPQWLSFGKLRASVAWVGNGTDPYATSFGSYNQGTIIDRNGNSVVVAGLNNAAVLPNLNLKPETQRSIELGTNLTFLNDRINFDLAWYKTNTFNQILTIPGVIETGYNSRRINAGNIQNQGIEIQVNGTPVKSRNLNWDVSVNFSRNRGKILSFYPGIKEFALMGDYDGAGVYAYEGGSFGVLTANFSNGSWREHDAETGFPIIKVGERAIDTDPSRKTDFQEYTWVNEKFDPEKNPRHNIGSVEPNFLAGFNTALRWKQFSLYAQIDSRIGGWAYSESYSYGMGRGNLLETLKYRDAEHGGVARTDSYTGETVYNGAVPDAVFAVGEKSPLTGADIGGMTFKEAYENKLVEPWYAGSYYPNTFGWGTNFDAGAATEVSWVMLREVSLGYQLPKSIIGRVKIKGANFRLTARNIGYLYNGLNGGQNPASLQSNNPFNPIISGAVPFARNFAATLNLNF